MTTQTKEAASLRPGSQCDMCHTVATSKARLKVHMLREHSRDEALTAKKVNKALNEIVHVATTEEETHETAMIKDIAILNIVNEVYENPSLEEVVIDVEKEK